MVLLRGNLARFEWEKSTVFPLPPPSDLFKGHGVTFHFTSPLATLQPHFVLVCLFSDGHPGRWDGMCMV